MSNFPPEASPVKAIEGLEKAIPDGVLFAALVGSRAKGQARADSDWDIAVLWKQMDALERISRHEYLRRELAHALSVSEDKIDLIDLSNAGLAMRALVVEEGMLIVAHDQRAWCKFQERTWREVEEFYWEKSHAV